MPTLAAQSLCPHAAAGCRERAHPFQAQKWARSRAPSVSLRARAHEGNPRLCSTAPSVCSSRPSCSARQLSIPLVVVVSKCKTDNGQPCSRPRYSPPRAKWTTSRGKKAVQILCLYQNCALLLKLSSISMRWSLLARLALLSRVASCGGDAARGPGVWR